MAESMEKLYLVPLVAFGCSVHPRMERNDKDFSLHVLVQIFYLELSSTFSEELIYSLEETVLWILYFCLCPKDAGSAVLVLAGAVCLQSLLPGSQERASGHN